MYFSKDSKTYDNDKELKSSSLFERLIVISEKDNLVFALEKSKIKKE